MIKVLKVAKQTEMSVLFGVVKRKFGEASLEPEEQSRQINNSVVTEDNGPSELASATQMILRLDKHQAYEQQLYRKADGAMSAADQAIASLVENNLLNAAQKAMLPMLEEVHPRPRLAGLHAMALAAMSEPNLVQTLVALIGKLSQDEFDDLIPALIRKVIHNYAASPGGLDEHEIRVAAAVARKAGLVHDAKRLLVDTGLAAALVLLPGICEVTFLARALDALMPCAPDRVPLDGPTCVACCSQACFSDNESVDLEHKCAAWLSGLYFSNRSLFDLPLHGQVTNEGLKASLVGSLLKYLLPLADPPCLSVMLSFCNFEDTANDSELGSAVAAATLRCADSAETQISGARAFLSTPYISNPQGVWPNARPLIFQAFVQALIKHKQQEVLHALVAFDPAPDDFHEQRIEFARAIASMCDPDQYRMEDADDRAQGLKDAWTCASRMASATEDAQATFLLEAGLMTHAAACVTCAPNVILHMLPTLRNARLARDAVRNELPRAICTLFLRLFRTKTLIDALDALWDASEKQSDLANLILTNILDKQSSMLLASKVFPHSSEEILESNAVERFLELQSCSRFPPFITNNYDLQRSCFAMQVLSKLTWKETELLHWGWGWFVERFLKMCYEKATQNHPKDVSILQMFKNAIEAGINIIQCFVLPQWNPLVNELIATICELLELCVLDTSPFLFEKLVDSCISRQDFLTVLHKGKIVFEVPKNMISKKCDPLPIANACMRFLRAVPQNSLDKKVLRLAIDFFHTLTEEAQGAFTEEQALRFSEALNLHKRS
jgi:hypothetical protein